MDRELDALPEGTKLAGYVIGRVLGRGGFGITYFATDALYPGDKVAIKEFFPAGLALREAGTHTVRPISPSRAESFRRALASFEREARTLVALRHPNVVEAQRYIEQNGTAYVVMKFEEGRSLGDWLGREKTLSESEIRGFLPSLLDGLAAVHAQNFVHRDVKPANIYLRAKDGSPVLLDFGAAREAIGDERKTSLSEILTPGYAPLEQYDRHAAQGPYTDIYALGATLYRCMTGAAPPEAITRHNALRRGAPDTLEPIEKAAANRYSAALLAAVRASLIIDERQRPQSVAALREILSSKSRAVEPSKGGGETIVIDIPPPEHDPIPGLRRGMALAVMGGILLAVPAVLPFAFFAPPLRDIWPPSQVYVLLGAVAAMLALVGLSPPYVFFGRTQLPGERGVLSMRRGLALVIGGLALATSSVYVFCFRVPSIRFDSEGERTYVMLIALGVLALLAGIPTAFVIGGRRRFGLWLAVGTSILGVLAVTHWVLAIVVISGPENVLRVPSYLGFYLGMTAIGLAALPLWLRSARILRVKGAPVWIPPDRGMALVAVLVAVVLLAASRAIPWRAELALSPRASAAPGSAEACRDGTGWRAGCVFRDCPECPEMVVIPAGFFTMGSPPGKMDYLEGPQHNVTIGRPFALAKYETTRGEYGSFVGDTGYRAADSGWCLVFNAVQKIWLGDPAKSWRDLGFPQTDRHPAACISWEDAKAHTAWLARKTGKAYRLPSEAEWEYAARGRTTTPTYWGGEPRGRDTCQHANGFDLSRKALTREGSTLPCNDGYAYTAPVGSFPANAFGLHDMNGNVEEWVEDCAHRGYVGAPSDGRAWTTKPADCGQRVLRGGSWAHLELRSATFEYTRPQDRWDYYGFRVARELE